jgi:radical SAM superfamily enzyme YgiQ (UPF0313 family)
VARDLLDEKHGIVHVATQRGCPFGCAYCSARALHDLYAPARYERRRSCENVVAELRALQRRAPLNYVVFLDDTFTVPRGWVEEFCPLYAAEVGVGFTLHARPDTVDPPILARLAAAGCRQVVYGVESGSERVRREIMRRPIGDAAILDAFRWTKDAGILVTANYMFGLPGETADDLARTRALHERLAPADFGFFAFHPYPGTALYELCRARGYLAADHLERTADNRRSILSLPGLSADDVDACGAAFAALREGRTLGAPRVETAGRD